MFTMDIIRTNSHENCQLNTVYFPREAGTRIPDPCSRPTATAGLRKLHFYPLRCPVWIFCIASDALAYHLIFVSRQHPLIIHLNVKPWSGAWQHGFKSNIHETQPQQTTIERAAEITSS